MSHNDITSKRIINYNPDTLYIIYYAGNDDVYLLSGEAVARYFIYDVQTDTLAPYEGSMTSFALEHDMPFLIWKGIHTIPGFFLKNE